jgi:hypothetical protein
MIYHLDLMIRSSFRAALPDVIAAGLSAACLVHCVGLPLLLAAIPALARLISVPEWFHLAAFVFAVPASALAVWIGARRHGAMLPALLGSWGLALLGVGVLAGFDEGGETGLTVLGSVLLATAHWRNWRLSRPFVSGNGAAGED